MNKKRREEILSISQKIDIAVSELESLKEDEDEARENIPENLVGSVRYEESEEASDLIENTIESIRDALANLEEL